MPSRFASIEEISASNNSFEKRLEAHPELKARFELLLGVVENAAGDVEKAAEAEQRVIEELRQLGNEVLHAWARSQEQKKEAEYSAKPGVNRKEKKPLLVHALRDNRASGADFHRRAARARVAALL